MRNLDAPGPVINRAFHDSPPKAPNENGEPQITMDDGRRILFYVGGIAFLTTIVNATTCLRYSLEHVIALSSVFNIPNQLSIEFL